MASEEEGDFQEENEFVSTGKSGMIMLIDARRSMFTPYFADKKRTKFNLALECCRSVIINKIIARQKDLVGVVLFGTNKDDPKTKTKHVNKLLDLNFPNADAVSLLDKLLSDCQHDWGFSDNFLIADALWYCSSLFSHSNTNLTGKRILLFTDDHNPHLSHSDRAHMARKRAKDLNQIGISLELLPLEQDFGYSKFYKELVETANGSSDTELPSFSDVQQLTERVNRLDFKSRRYAKIKWDLGKGVCVGISLYTLFSQTTIAPKEPLSRTTNEPVKRVKQILDQATGEVLLPSDIEEYITVAGQDIVFTTEEKELMKKVMEPGMTLLGFKPFSLASAALHCSHASFAYPEETLIKGSQTLVKALVEQCIAKQRLPLCCITSRQRAATKYVCLLPSLGDGIEPLGFHVITLPFYNDTREQTFKKSPNLSEETLDLTKKLITKLKFPYTLNRFQNPKLQQFWGYLEALALEYNEPEEHEDDTVVPFEEQSKRLGDLADQFNSLCNLTGIRSSTTTKRPSSAAQSSAKKVKLSSLEQNDFFQDISNAVKLQKGVEKFTVVQLKAYMLHHNQGIYGMKKADLVKAIYSLP